MTDDSPAPSRSLPIPGSALEEWYRWGRDLSLKAGVPLGELDWFVLAVTDADRLTLRLGSLGDRPTISSTLDLATLTERWKERCRDRTPVQYLAGHTPWRTLTLQVTPAVLIPRPETELLVDLVDQKLQAIPLSPKTPILIADLGTGSGAIALGLAELLPHAKIYAVDCSAEALAIARHNGAGATNPVIFLQGSWFEPLAHLRGRLMAMVSNPPYIPSATVTTLDPEVIHHEPRLALDGGEDGLDDIRHLIAQAPQYLQSGGLWAIEHMAGQGEIIAQLLAANGNYSRIERHRDLTDRDRFVTAHRL